MSDGKTVANGKVMSNLSKSLQKVRSQRSQKAILAASNASNADAQLAKKNRITSKVKVSAANAFSINPPPNAVNTNPPKGKRLPVDVGLHQVAIRDILLALISFNLIPYHNNRGGFGVQLAKIDPKKVNRIADNFRIDSIGEMTVKYDAKTLLMTMCDFHNRAMALLKRFYEGRSTEDELDEKVSFRVVDNHVLTYSDLGTCNPAKARERIENPDLCFGWILEKQLYPILSDEAETTIRNSRKFLTPIATCLYALGHMDSNDSKQWGFTDVYNCRGNAKEWQFLPKGFECADKDVQKLAQCIEEFVEFVGYYRKSSPTIAKQIDKMIFSSTFFYFFLFDKLSGKPLISTPKVLANRIVNKAMLLNVDIPNLIRGSNAQQDIKLAKMYKTLGFK